jgi:DNA-binding NarL/FixJ family response regulator
MSAQRQTAHPESTATHPIEVLLVDDHQAVVDALAMALGREPDIHVVGAVGSVREVADPHTARPDVALVDFGLPDGTGADACRLIKARWPTTRIVMLSATDFDADVMACIRAGADGYVTKGQRLAVLVRVLHDAYAGRPIVAPELLGRIAQGLQPRPSEPFLKAPLTPRELGVLRALADGQATRVIATDMGIAEGTVLRHVESIRRKFGVSTRLEAVTRAIQHHIVQPPAL